MVKTPEGYRRMDSGPAILIVKEEYTRPLLDLGITEPETFITGHPDTEDHATGRGTVLSVPLGDRTGTRVMVRKYLRGGLVRWVNKELFFGNKRPFHELLIGTEAVRRGIPTALPLAAVSIRVAVSFFRCYLITRELTNCIDLPRYLKDLRDNSIPNAGRKKERVLVKTAETVKTMHDQGLLHADLNMKNILVDKTDAEKIYIIDWDKSLLRNGLNPAERSANIIRFCRSMVKLAQNNVPVSEKDPALFLESYWKDSAKVSADLKKLEKTVRRRKTAWKVLR